MPKQKDLLKDKIRELQLRRLRQSDSQIRRGNDYVPAKKKAKPLGYKMQNTFDQNLRGVPGGALNHTASAIKMIAAPGTGTRTRREEIGLLRSARNANTTSGSYISTVVREGDEQVSDAQGRKVFGR